VIECSLLYIRFI